MCMMKIFINNVNTYSGSCLCKTFDEIKNEKTEIYGTVDDQELSKDDCIMYNYDNVKKIISKIPKDNIVKYILKCKLVIYDLHNTDLEEIEYVIRKLKYEKIKNNMTIILISSIMTWNKTKRKFIKKIVEENKEITKNQYDNIGDKSGETNNNLEKKDNKNVEKNNQKTSKKKDKKKNENHIKNNKILDHGVSNKHGNIIKNEDIKSDLQQNLNEKINKKEKILYIPQIFNEKDYLKRISSAHFDEYKSVETLILSLNSMKNIKTHVVVSGLLYGNGESVFFSIFKNAWLSKDNHIIDKGDNYIPVIHIRGLCEYIKQLYISESKKKYLIAVDNQYITQKELIHTIASHLSGNMNFMHVSPHESIFYEHSEKLCVNLRFQCTNIYDDNEGKEQGKKKKSNKINKNKKKNEEEDISDNDEEDISDNDEGDISDNDEGDISDNDKEDISDNDKEDNDSDTDNSDSDKTEGNTEDENIDSEESSNINMNDSNDDSKNGSIIDNDNNDDSDSDNSNMKKKDKKKKKNLKQTKNKNKNKNKNKTKNIITFHCQDGFINNIAIIAKEFCEFRNLKNLKVLIIGQPGVGKTFIAKKICDHYNLIMCSINILIDEYKNRTDYTFPKYYQEYINELDNEKKKNVPPKKLTLSDLSSLFYSKLENNECKFRGFVLDFFPRNYEEAKFFFENYKREVPEKDKEMSNGKRDEEDKNIKGNNKSKKKAKKKKNEEDDKEEKDNDKEEEDNEKEEDDNDKEEDDNDMEEEDDDDKEEEDDDDKEENEDDEDENDDDKEKDDNDEDENDDDSEEGNNNNDNSDYNEDNDDEKISENSENSENTNMLTHSDEESQSVKKSSNKKKKKKRKKKKKIIENINKYIIMPEFVIILKSTEELCKKRMMNLPENEIIKGHNDEIGFERRHKKYINENCRNDYFEFDQKQSIEDYFIENDIEVYTLNINENTLLEHILTNIYIFIEKNVKFNNFLPSTDEMLKNKLQEEQQILMDEKQKIKDIEDKVVLEEIKQNDDLIKAEKKRQQLLIKHQQQYIHNQSVPLRFYLIKNILPILTDALIYICKTKPKNPCLHIAQYLLENAHKYNIEEPNLENLQPEKDDEDNQINEKPKDEN